MLRTNLSTRPFYNERLVHVALGAAALLLFGVTVFNVARIVTLTQHAGELNDRTQRAESQAADLRAQATRLRRTVDARELAVVSAAAREANLIIDRRTFSWTELFNRFEATLPPDVRIASVRPKPEKDGSITVAMIVVGRRVEDVDTFIEALEATGTFADVLTTEDFVTESGLHEATLEGRYVPAPARSVSEKREHAPSGGE